MYDASCSSSTQIRPRPCTGAKIAERAPTTIGASPDAIRSRSSRRAASLSPECWQDPSLMALVQKVKVSVSEEANRRAPEAMLSVVEIVTTRGERLRAEVPYHRGHYKNPMSDQEIEAKLYRLAAEWLTSRQIDVLLDRLWNLDQVPDIGEVIRLVKI